ncbi:lytic murein transglycosylase [Vibrio sp. 10N.286.49.C2]|uniref:murein transglycosylase n=1 Tax=unclassified Vibrio TaxID=2614977 RepID=UPI000C828854|nr:MULTISPECIES: murein transglycosylase [unclassified Vibrio]PMH27649.1 lytic murein transglycosylase [Vibrio sp. 10N.286.49.C2]PMH53075.1 lytic murein transglycosylase [Vibrio sp. 10N.286.49.B1]PMH80170.1 lytic murein transglycosylase [Vibrio sp. 10N.286.48.B7]
MNRQGKGKLAWTAILSCLVSVGSVQAQEDAKLKKQRAIYDKAQSLIDRKDISGYQSLRPQIADYPLTPYIDNRVFSLELSDKSVAQVNQFMADNQALPFSSRVRAPYLDRLAQRKQWDELLAFQTTYPKGERYQCLYHYAQLKTGNREEAFKGAGELWKSGKSVSDACDPLFSEWAKAGFRTDERLIERMTYAYQSRNGSLIKYLNKQLKTNQGQAQGKQVGTLFSSPQQVTSFIGSTFPEPYKSELIESAFKKLARSDSDQAYSIWPTLSANEKISNEIKQSMADYLAMRLINTESSSEAKWRDGVLANSSNDINIERRARLAIQQSDWTGLLDWIGKLSQAKRDSSRWQYWIARVEIKSGNQQQGEERLQRLVGERNFYSAAAATYLEHSIVYPISRVTIDTAVLEPYEDSLVRIKELVVRDKIAAAKSEWRYLLSRVSKDEKTMLAAYAGQQGWHHFTVVATISAKMWDNMSLRFPIAHRWWFDFYAKELGLDSVMMMALARQESAMDVEARSPVGARGVMQIMPATAKYTAKKYKISYSSSKELYNVGKNIEIGSHYLNGLLGDYDNNRIFAFAAYNAGPNRVKRWRQRSDEQLDVFAFIETIPFKETRGYVQNILMFQTYYRDRLGIEGSFLTTEEANRRY